MKRPTKADKTALIETIAALYKITQTLAGGLRNSEVPVKDLNGNGITGIADQTNRWKSHFETILNKEAPNNLAYIQVSDERGVLSVLLYAAEAWKFTKGICQMLVFFLHNTCLGRILRI